MLLPGIQNWAHLHLVTNHIPIIGLGLVSLWLLWGHLIRSEEVVRAGYLMLVLVALGTAVTFVSGREAALKPEVMMSSWFNLQRVQEHQERGHIGAYVVWAAGAAALLALILQAAKRRVPKALVGAILALTLIGTGVVAWVADAGGRIHHEEIRR